MRIITGIYKGRKLHFPRGIRPTQDKVRKALFDILGDIKGLSFLELFAGSGAIGFEALSRGVKDLTLVEYNQDCLLAIKRNIESLKTDACQIYPQETGRAIRSLNASGRKFDIIFLDPPYYKVKAIPSLLLQKSGDGSAAGEQMKESLSKNTLQILGACDILAPTGFIIVQHFKKDELPKESVFLSLLKEARYGDTIISFYQRQEG
jgi:16S rRNA G966 N2-methylase RsmD